MENPEGVGLVTAVAVSGGFVLLSKLLSGTFHHLDRARRRRRAGPTTLFPPTAAAPPPPYHLRLREGGSSSPYLSPRSRPSDRGEVVVEENLNTKESLIVTPSAASAECEAAEGWTSMSNNEAGANIFSSSTPRTDAPVKPEIRRFDRRSRAAVCPKSRNNMATGAPTILMQYRSSHTIDTDLKNMRDAVAARYQHESTEPCSLAKKYLGRTSITQYSTGRSITKRADAEGQSLRPIVTTATSASISLLHPAAQESTTSSSALIRKPDERVKTCSKKVRFSSSMLKEQRRIYHRCHHELSMPQEACEDHSSTTFAERRQLKSTLMSRTRRRNPVPNGSTS